MKSKGAASNLRVKVPNEQANPDASASGPPGQTAPKEQHDPPVPKLNDIPPLNWKKRTLTPTSSTPPTSSKRRPTGTPQGPRYDLMSKASAPDLRKQNAHADGTDKEKSPSRPGTRYNLRKKSSAPDLRRAAKDHAPGVGDCPPLPRPKTTQNIRDPDNSDDLDDGPRFMVPKAEDKKKSPEFKSHLLSGPKLPSIIGSAPSRMRPKKKPAAMPVKQTRSKRLMGILKHPAFKTRWKSTARNLTKMRVMKRAYGCVKFFRNGAKRRLALQGGPAYRLKEKKRASMMPTLPNIKRLSSIRSLCDLALSNQSKAQENDKNKDPEENNYNTDNHDKDPEDNEDNTDSQDDNESTASEIYRSMFPPDYTDPRTPLPPPEGPPGFEFTNLVGRHRIVRGSMAPYMGWLDIMGSSANPYADEINERPRANTATVNTSDNPSVRASLLPFKNWAAIPDSNRNTSVLENPREAPVPPSSTLPSSAHSCSSSTNPLPHPSHTFPSPREDISNLSAKCLRFTPSQSTTSYSKENEVKDPTMPGDPFLESSTAERGGLTQMGSEAFAYHREGATKGPNGDTEAANPQENAPAARPSGVEAEGPSEKAKQRADGAISRIPRVPTQKRGPGLTGSAQRGPINTPERHSSIPVSARKHSAEASEFRHETPGHEFSGGIRMVENAGRRFLPGRPNPKPEVDGPAEEFDSSSTSSWGNTYHAEEVTMERPKGLTGEDRVRPKTRSQLLEKYGPQLKICPSAERILVGDDHDTPERQTSYTQEVARPGSAISGYEHDNAQGARQFGFRQDENVSPGSAREVPNYCRPLSPENNTRVNRKPVPKNSIMDQSHSEEGLSTTPQADPFSRMGTLDSYPVRSSSLQAQTGLDFTARSPEASKNLALNEKGSSPASDDIAQEEGHGQNESSAKLPDSKSIRMLDSFRNMFSKSRASERSVTGKEQAGGHNTKRRSKNVASTIESGKSDHQAKAKAKRSKNTRNLRVEDISSPMPLIATLSSVLPSPAPSYSSVPASSRGRQEIRTPSFARPTQSTRTRQAASANARQTSVAQEARTNRIKVLTPSTGSPSRSRIQKRTTPAASSTLKRQESQEGSDVSDRPNLPEKNTPTPGKLTDSGQMGIDSVQGCIDVLRVKIYNATDPRKREKYLHLVLTLQQQLSDYRNIEKEAKDFESLSSQKKTDKGMALHSMIRYLDEVLSQLDEDDFSSHTARD